MARVSDWCKQLYRTLGQFVQVPREFGKNDCCQVVAICIEAMTGADVRSRFPTYNSQAEAEAIIASLGGMEDLIKSVLGAPKLISRANVGDVVVSDFADGLSCGICLGQLTTCMTPAGLGLFRTRSGIAAWTV